MDTHTEIYNNDVAVVIIVHLEYMPWGLGVSYCICIVLCMYCALCYVKFSRVCFAGYLRYLRSISQVCQTCGFRMRLWKTISSLAVSSMDWFRGRFAGKPHIFWEKKNMVSRRFSLQPIQSLADSSSEVFSMPGHAFVLGTE